MVNEITVNSRNLDWKCVFQGLKSFELEKCIFKLKNRFCEKIFDVPIGCMGASKRWFKVRRVLRNPFGVTRSHLEAFFEKWNFWIFFDFFNAKVKDFLSFWLDFWACGCKKWLFSKNNCLIKNPLDKTFHLVIFFHPVTWLVTKWSG